MTPLRRTKTRRDKSDDMRTTCVRNELKHSTLDPTAPSLGWHVSDNARTPSTLVRQLKLRPCPFDPPPSSERAGVRDIGPAFHGGCFRSGEVWRRGAHVLFVRAAFYSGSHGGFSQFFFSWLCVICLDDFCFLREARVESKLVRYLRVFVRKRFHRNTLHTN